MPHESFESLESRTLFVAYTIDQSFGDGGRPVRPGRDSYTLTYVGRTDAGLLYDNQAYLTGFADRFYRYTLSGKVDPSYVGPTLPKSASETAKLVDAAGRALWVSAADGNTVAVNRYGVNGPADTSFGERGRTTVSLPVPAYRAKTVRTDIVSLQAVADAGGSVFVLARIDTRDASDYRRGASATYLFRLNSRGKFDRAFGRVALGAERFDRTLTVDSNGNLLVGTRDSGLRRYTVTRYTAAGKIDTAFATGGTYTVRLSYLDRLDEFRLAADTKGRLLLSRGGPFSKAGAYTTITRLTAAGRADPAFSGDGYADVGTPAQTTFVGLYVGTDDRVSALIAPASGTGSAPNVLVRFTADGTPDTTLGTAGRANLTENFAGIDTRLPDGNYLIEGGKYAPLSTTAPYRLSFGELTILAPSDDASKVRLRRLSDGRVRATFNGAVTDFAAGQVRRVVAFLGNGSNDFDSALDVQHLVYGGSGDDTITTGAGDDFVVADYPRTGTGTGDPLQGPADGYARISSGGGRDDISLGYAGVRGYDVDAGSGGGNVRMDERLGGGPTSVVGSSGHWNVQVTGTTVGVRLGGFDAAVRVNSTGPSTIDVTRTTDGSQVYASPHGSTILTGRGPDTVYGSDRPDRITTGRGDDLVYANRGTDTVDAGAGDDTVYGGFGSDVITGGAGSDRLYGEDGSDRLYGNTADTSGETGFDRNVLDGGRNTDTARRGADDDVLVSVEIT